MHEVKGRDGDETFGKDSETQRNATEAGQVLEDISGATGTLTIKFRTFQQVFSMPGCR